MAKLSPARRCALGLVSASRRRNGRIRDIARADEATRTLSPLDRSLALRLAVGAIAAHDGLDLLINAQVRRPSSLEPRVRDALHVAAFEVCYLSTPTAVSVSQGVELVRSVAPRAAGLANAVLRKLAQGAREEIAAARERCRCNQTTIDDLMLVSGMPEWLVGCIASDRGRAYAARLCAAYLEPAPFAIALNGLRHTPEDAQRLLAGVGVNAGVKPVLGMPGTYVLQDGAPLAASHLLEDCDVTVADLSAQLVCRIAAQREPYTVLEVGQGRATKTMLLCTACGTIHPTHAVGIDSVGFKTHLAAKRLTRAGLDDKATSLAYDATELEGTDLPAPLATSFDTVLVDAPCSGTGTMRRHPETAYVLTPADVEELAQLQLRMLKAASARVGAGGTLVYSTCSVLRAEDEGVVEAFLASEEGAPFAVGRASAAPCCEDNPELVELVQRYETPEGYVLGSAAAGESDGHFCARLLRR